MPILDQPSFPFESEPKSQNSSPIKFATPDAEVFFWKDFYSLDEANNLFFDLLNNTEWQQQTVKYYGSIYNLPRLTAWYGDSGAKYKYSGIINEPLPWTPTLQEIREKISKHTGHIFNSALLNLYRSGSDRLSWHQDNEPELGPEPAIASISLGETRTFQLRHRFRKELQRIDIPLLNGSLLLMKGSTQTFWQHQIPKTSRIIGQRINITFRNIKAVS
jgi:alkylated DNA repair dioxygenase AlkB